MFVRTESNEKKGVGALPAAQSGAFSPISKRFRVQFPVGEHTWVAGLMPVRVQPWVRVK